MTNDRAWAFQYLTFRDPRRLLLEYRRLSIIVAAFDLPEKVKNLRTNELKPWSELRAACLFCYGMGQRIGQTESGPIRVLDLGVHEGAFTTDSARSYQRERRGMVRRLSVGPRAAG